MEVLNVSSINKEDNKSINIDKPAPRSITVNGIDLMDLQIAKKKIGIQVSKANRKITPGRKKKNTPLTPASRNIVKYLVKKKSGEDNTNNGRKPSIVENNVKTYKKIH